MSIFDNLKSYILRKLSITKLNTTPNNPRMVFLGSERNVLIFRALENKTWYYGNSDDLLAFFSGSLVSSFLTDPIYFRNKRGYYWSVSATEQQLKRVHSGVPNAICNTMSGIVGVPRFKLEDSKKQERLEKILEKNNFDSLVVQTSTPLTLAVGWGAFKINIRKDLSDMPIIEFYTGENVEFVKECGILQGVIFRDYYRIKDKLYAVVEVRRKDKDKSYIETQVYETTGDYYDQNAYGTKVNPSEVEGLEQYADNNRVLGINDILAVPSIIFHDSNNPNYGRSIYAGKQDLFDDLDQCISQRSQTIRVSTPVEYYNTQVLGTSANGEQQLPNKFNRQFIQKTDIPNGDGQSKSDDIITTQPNLHLEQYNLAEQSLCNEIFSGFISPASMGIDIAKKDNAEAQREKEKCTIQTRKTIIIQQTQMYKQLANLLLKVDDYMQTGKLPNKDYDISVSFDEFANPSFENQLETLGKAWSNGEISTDKYIELLWRDKMTDEEKAEEKAKLENMRNKDNLEIGELEEDVEHESDVGTNLRPKEDENKERKDITTKFNSGDLFKSRKKKVV